MALSAIGLVGVGYAYGMLSFQYELFPHAVLARTRALLRQSAAPSGLWMSTPARRNSGGLTEEQQRQLEQLRGLGYLSGYESAPDETGLVVHNSAASYEGYNLYTSVTCPPRLYHLL